MQPVTPYIWKYQPETGSTSGARQDYGSVVNWLSSCNNLFERVYAVNSYRNYLDKKRGGAYRSLAFVKNDSTGALTGAGSIGSTSPPDDGGVYRKVTRDALPFPHGWQKLDGGVWKWIQGDDTSVLVGGAANALSTYPTIVRSPSVDATELAGSGLRIDEVSPHTGFPKGMTPLGFAQRFPPVVYTRPFSSKSLRYFPKEFNPLFDPSEDPRGTSAFSLQYKRVD
ncbi:pVIII [Barthadenovirus mellis]|uniref:PVIII n=1 Tax=Passerine adenovirus 1 TaxID=2779174 RepID=A0A7L9DHZ7_9ADEN|nr:pVIII [Passerine adenovirus 1]